MKLTLRRIGNSLGVIIPRATLDGWGVSEGDALDLTDRGIRPPGRAQQDLDELKRRIAVEVVNRFHPQHIRAQILANLHRWKASGAWIPAYDEWRAIAKTRDDGALFAAMLGRDQRSTRLRQSMAFVGLLPKDVVTKLNDEASA
jgi:antitoxin component of MazEF toxin-antitoxin module